MQFIDKKTIKLDRIINELDRFVFNFIKILEKHADYVIVSGYISILFGRARSTEDVDVFVDALDKERFDALYKDLKKHGYWCLNAEDVNKVFSYLTGGLSIRFAIENETIPNFEVKFAKKTLARESFNDRITVITSLGKIKISSIERQIAFKKYYLKSDKDLEDAKYIEELFKDHIDIKKIEEYKRLIKNEMA